MFVGGEWVKSKTEPMTYWTYNFFLGRCGIGSEEIVQKY
jgi:hypothetical protein